MEKYRELISLIPVDNQSSKIKKEVWKKFSYKNKDSIEDAIFGDFDEVELSRKDVLSETDTAKKIVKVLMWGYPTGGRGNHIKNILTEIETLRDLLSNEENKDLSKDQAYDLIKKFNDISGLGASTWSKLLYFFGFSIDSKKCQIYDLKIVDSLNKKQFIDLGTKKWKQVIDDYYQYIELLNALSARMHVFPDQVELFLFSFNYYYKF